MILILLGALLSILVPVLIYKYIMKGTETGNRKLYIKTFLLAATLFTLPIIILEIIWDTIFFSPGSAATIGQDFAISFTRAALLEEAVKYFFCYRVLKRHQDLGLKESVLMAGVIGIGYGFTEKLVYLNPVAMITNGLIPGHMVYQWFMGFLIYKAMRAEGSERRKNYLLAFIVPFLIHGLWDFGLDVPDYIMDSDTAMMVIGGVFVLAMIILMIVVTIIAAKKLRKIED